MVTLLKILQSLPLPRLLPLRCFLLGTTSRSYEDDYYNSNPTGNNNSKRTNHTESTYATTQEDEPENKLSPCSSTSDSITGSFNPNLTQFKAFGAITRFM